MAGHTLDDMTAVEQMPDSETHLTSGIPQLARETLELELEYHLSTVVPFTGPWIAFERLQGTGRLAPRQATMPVTDERRGEGARV
ncbi:hypothetical protein B1R27_05190 [Streptomyces sp. GKU 895]|nr:hypothetical protein B1R27_05190 [Streptomyces sp. GKU 895]